MPTAAGSATDFRAADLDTHASPLRVLGMDAASEAVYRLLLQRPGEDAPRLAAGLGLATAVVDGALERLRAMGLVRPAAGPAGALHAVSPDLGTQILLTRQEAELSAWQQRIQERRAAAARLLVEFPAPRGGAPGGDVEFLDGVDQVRDFLAVLNTDVAEEMLTFAPGGALTEANMTASRPLNRRLLERGVQMRTVYLDSLRLDRPSVAHAEWLTRQGGEVRTVPTLPNRMIICDRRVAILAVNNESTGQGAVVLRIPGVIEMLCALFEETWQRGAPLGAPQHRDRTGCTPQQVEAVRLLAEGHTDQAVAKRLGVSLRTARRTAAGVMSLLGARSRFQAGVHAAQRGWLPFTGTGPDSGAHHVGGGLDGTVLDDAALDDGALDEGVLDADVLDDGVLGVDDGFGVPPAGTPGTGAPAAGATRQLSGTRPRRAAGHAPRAASRHG